MQLTESVVYRYLSFLRETNAAPTLADATVKAIWFMHSTANIVNFNPKVFTSRIAGVRRDLYLRKRILRQAPPFPADLVRALEEYALHAENRVDSMFTNFILFCIFSSCRIGDAAKIREVEFSRYHDIFLVEAATSEAKNTNTHGETQDAAAFYSHWLGPSSQSMVHQVGNAVEGNATRDNHACFLGSFRAVFETTYHYS